MPIRLACPRCAATFSVPDDLEGTNVRCQQCGRDVLVSRPTPAEPALAEDAPTPGPRPRAVRRRADDLAPAAPRRRPDRETDAAPRSSASALPWILAGGGALLVVMLLVGGVVAALLVRSRLVAEEQREADRRAEVERQAAQKEAERQAELERARRRDRWNPPPPRFDDRQPPRLEGPPAAKRKDPPVRPPFVPVALPPLPPALEIKPPEVVKETSYKLPEPASTLRVGGGGRFLVLHFPRVRKFGLFDVNEAKIVRYVNAAEDDVKFAAGMNKLVVYLPGSKLVQRYDLLTGDREASQKLELPAGKIEAFCMGHASAGPLLVGVAGHDPKLYDVDKFAEIELPFEEVGDNDLRFGREPQRQRLPRGLYWAGATGRVFGNTDSGGGQPNGVAAVTFEGGRMQHVREHKGTWYVVPGPDDNTLYPAGHGVTSTRIKPVPNVPFSMGGNSGYASHVYLPACHGPYYLHAQTIEDHFRDQKAVPQGTIRLFMQGDATPLMTLSNTAAAKYAWEGLRGFGLENSIQLIPKAKLLIVVPDTRDELRLYPADLEAALEKSGRDYLIFTSPPPATFRKGQEFTYQAAAKAKKGPVTFKVDSGPKGMTVDDRGQVKWAVPEGFGEKRVDVILSARAAGGREAFQTFTLSPDQGR